MPRFFSSFSRTGKSGGCVSAKVDQSATVYCTNVNGGGVFLF